MYSHPTALHSLATRAIVGAVVVALRAEGVSAAVEHWVQIFPAGEFRARDGRPEKLDAWRVDRTAAEHLIALVRAQATVPVVDYEHQTLHAETNGQPAPAAGWMRDLEWREGEGLFARIEWTDRALAAIRAGEYRYFSPVFESDPKTGVVTRLLMGAITNYPGLDGMLPVAARATSTTEQESETVNKLLAAIVAALALPADTTEDQAATAITALTGKLADRDREIVTLKAATTATDPSRFVPLAAFDQVKGELAALTAKLQGNETEALIAAGLADGRLHSSLESWARDLGKTSPAALKSYLDTATPIAALKGTQTNGQPPVPETGAHGLTAEELVVCTATGIDPETFAKTKVA